MQLQWKANSMRAYKLTMNSKNYAEMQRALNSHRTVKEQQYGTTSPLRY